MSAGLRALFITLILAAVAWTTREVASFGFLPLVDDDVNIFYNPHLGAPDAARLHWMATDFSYVHRYMPLGWLGFAAVYCVSGLDPWGYHVAGVLLHSLNAVLVFLILDRLLRRFAGSVNERDRILCAGVAALLWALHPLRVETTAWCSGLLYSQAGFFALLCVCARLTELQALGEKRQGRSALSFGAGWFAYVASVLTYPVALFLPFALVVVDHAWLATGTPKADRPLRTARAGSALYIATSLAGLALTFLARGTAHISWLKAPTLADFGPLARALQGAYVAVVYCWRTLWSGDIGGMPLTLFDAGAPQWLAWAFAVLLAVLSWLAWRVRRTAPYVPACWICYLMLVTPNLGLTEHPHTIADRYLYFTGIVFSVALAFCLARMRSRTLLRCALLFCALAAVACSLVSVVQARAWRNTRAFQARMLENPDLDLQHITAARAGKMRFLEGDVQGGRQAVKRELELASSLGGVVLTWRQIAPAVPLSPAVAATRLQEWPAAPFAYAHAQIARDQMAEGRPADALAHLNAAIEIDPGFSDARFRRGVLLAEYGNPAGALNDWFYVERAARTGVGAGRGEMDFMTSTLEYSFKATGDAKSANAVGAHKRPEN